MQHCLDKLMHATTSLQSLDIIPSHTFLKDEEISCCERLLAQAHSKLLTVTATNAMILKSVSNQTQD